MERRQPDYEDERVRQWRARPEERREWGTDSTVMDVDLTREEIYESRVYDVRVDQVVDLLIEEVAEEPELAAVLLAALQVNAERDVTMRLTAKVAIIVTTSVAMTALPWPSNQSWSLSPTEARISGCMLGAV